MARKPKRPPPRQISKQEQLRKITGTVELTPEQREQLRQLNELLPRAEQEQLRKVTAQLTPTEQEQLRRFAIRLDDDPVPPAPPHKGGRKRALTPEQ